MGNPLSSAREALLAELLQEADALVRRFEAAEATIPERIGLATEEAAGKAFLAARLNFEAVLEQHHDRLIEAGHRAASEIGHQLAGDTARLVLAGAVLERRLCRLLVALLVLALAAGGVGGLIGAKVAILL